MIFIEFTLFLILGTSETIKLYPMILKIEEFFSKKINKN